MRITSKGQVTIPIAIREKTGLLPDTEVEFEIDEATGRTYILRSTDAFRESLKLVRSLRGKGSGKMTTDEIMALMRGPE